jgi:hypothetical protein
MRVIPDEKFIPALGKWFENRFPEGVEYALPKYILQPFQ